MPPDYRVISIGTLSANLLWNERTQVRTPHATTSLICVDDMRILVNPALPASVLGGRLQERAPVRPEDITHIFLTSLAIDHRHGMPGFEEAMWLAHEPEIHFQMDRLDGLIEDAEEHADRETVDLLEQQRAVLRRVKVAPDTLATGVDLFPLPGITPGTCGLLLSQPRATVLISGDAIATAGHFERAQVLPVCADVEVAQASFKEAIEIADIIVPGRDNVILC
jgi:glyoxylase-like metal-dependent hydrolase (beta-lactamase superfamily II)